MDIDLTRFTAMQRSFAEEYVLDLNATGAARRAGYKHPNHDGQVTLAIPKVRAYVDHLMAERSKRNAALQDKIINKLKAVAFADVNEVVQFRRCACRYCYGINHRYQWTDAEYERGCEAAEMAHAKPPLAIGGTGYNRRADPNPECPECMGEGRGEIHALDTRNLSAEGKALYAGAKSGRDGLEVKIVDQDKHLEMLMRHLGMFKDKVEHSGEIKSNAPVLNLTLTTPDAAKELKAKLEATEAEPEE